MKNKEEIEKEYEKSQEIFHPKINRSNSANSRLYEPQPPKGYEETVL